MPEDDIKVGDVLELIDPGSYVFFRGVKYVCVISITSRDFIVVADNAGVRIGGVEGFYRSRFIRVDPLVAALFHAQASSRL